MKRVDISHDTRYDLSMEELMKRLIAYKERKNITFERLARELDVPETYIYRWKNGNKISRANKRLLESFLSKLGD